MGGNKRELTWPRGVSLRTFGSESRIQIAFTFNGVECRELMPVGSITQSTINHAAGLRLQILSKIKAGEFDYAAQFPTSARAKQFDPAGERILVSKLLSKQLEIYEKQVENKTMSPSTLDGYRKAIKSERMKAWDGVTLAQATPARLRDWIAGMEITAKFARNLLTPLRSVFEDALNHELIESNPFDKIALRKLLKQSKKPSEYEVDPFSAAERNALIDAARPDEMPMVKFWLNVGFRPGEIIALRWDRIDWIGHKARVDLNVVAKTEKSPKTAAGIRDVDLNESALGALIAQKPVSFLAGERIFMNPRTGEPWETEAQIRKTLWETLCRRAGVRYRSPYQCRHTYASALLTAGTNPWYVSQQLGHVDVQMVFKIYGKFIPADYQKPRAGPRAIDVRAPRESSDNERQSNGAK